MLRRTSFASSAMILAASLNAAAQTTAPATMQQPTVIVRPGTARPGNTATNPTANTPLQTSPVVAPGSAINGQAALGIQTEELRCRGGSTFHFENRGLTQDGRSALVALYFGIPKANAAGQRPSAGANGEWLEPATCTFADRAFLPNDPPGVQFETAPASPERDMREMRSGSRRSAAESPNARSIPEYLSDESRFWTFSVYKTSYGHFQAVRHGAWTPNRAAAPTLDEWRTDSFGGDGGNPFDNPCEAGAYLAGIALRLGDDVDAVAPICGRVRPDGSRAETRTGRFAGGAGGEPRELLCPPQEPFVRAMRVAWDGEATLLVNEAVLRCGPLRGVLQAEMPKFNVLWQSAQQLSFDGYGVSPPIECPNAFAFAGLHGRAGAMVNRLGGICRQLASQ